MIFQRTLRRQVACAGIGLHSGQKVTLSLKPAPADSGIRFRRSDLGVDIPAALMHLSGTNHATGLSRQGATVDTVEHLLAALVSLVYLLQEAGTKTLSTPRRYLKVLRPITVSKGDKMMSLYPAENFKVTYSISFDHPLLRHQSQTFQMTEASFVDEIAPARTFGFLHEVEMLRQQGLALGGSLENAIVLSETGVLNNTLRFEDEFVRHKILDAIGDLALVGYPILGHLVASRAGHALHTALATQLLSEPDAWKIVELQPAPQSVAVPAGVPVRAV
jgi:UDP-3-O-[3-hydroxymyristoyl] N-acetylglucosamine deacetylase